MRRIFIFTGFFVLLGLLGPGFVFSQTTPQTTLSHDFTPPDTGVFYCWYKGYQFVYQNNEAKILIHNIPAPDRFVIWLYPFDISKNPYCSFRLKANKDLSMTVSFKDHGDPDNSVPQDQVDKLFTVPGDSTYRTYFFNLTDDLGTLAYYLDEIQFDPGAVSNASIWVDDFKIGTAAKPAYNKPNIDQAANIAVARNSSQQSDTLTGINDGSGGILTLAVTAVSDNTNLIPDPTVVYTNPLETAILKFTPVTDSAGTANITVTVTSSAPMNNTKTMKFKVVVNDLGGTSFSDNFDLGTIFKGWISSSEYSLTQQGGVLNIATAKISAWDGFRLELGKLYDFSANPYVNLKANSDVPFVLYVYLRDAFGNSAIQHMRIFPVTKLANYCFDFTGATGVNLKAIDGLIFAFNGPANNFSGNEIFEDLNAGSAALRFANIAGIADKAYYMNTGMKSILLTDIANASSVSVSGTGHVLKNASVGSIGADTARLAFTIITDSVGKDTLTLDITGASGFQDDTISFVVSVAGNMPPTIDTIAGFDALVGKTYTVKLAGITSGNPTTNQSISVKASSSNNAVVANPVTVSYKDGYPAGTLTLKPLAAGKATISVSAKNSGGDSTVVAFVVSAFSEWNNPPVIDSVSELTCFFGSGEKTVHLTGMGDGDANTQTITVEAASSDTSIVPNPILIYYTGNDTANLKFTPSSVKAGKSTITLTLTDNGGNAQNNGNRTTTIQFIVDTRSAPITGYVVPMTNFTADSTNRIWGPENWGVAYKLAYVDSGSFQAMKIDMKDKWDFGGIWMALPVELDLTKHPAISYEVYSVDTTTYHWNYFYDRGVGGSTDRNIENSTDYMLPVPKNKWTLLSFDYTNPGDLNNSEGNMIQISQINAVLFNLHYKKGTWPFTNFTGTVYYRNIRIGDKAIVFPKTYPCTVNGVTDLGFYVNTGTINIKLSGISDGQDSTSNVSISATSSNTASIPDPLVSSVGSDGTATLSLNVGSTTGTVVISVTVSAPGSFDLVMTFKVNVASDKVADASIVNIDLSKTYQTIEGLGTFLPGSGVADEFIDMGSSGVRLGVIENHVEPVNDNDDPFVLNMAALNHSSFDWDYLRYLKQNGVEKFILTLWSPPAWMKLSLSYPLIEQAVEWENTDSKVPYYLYDEYAENIIGTIKLIKQEADIDVYAVCPQNEPAFNEPYESAILGPVQFVKFIRVLGPRLQAEGLNTKIYMPEQVYGQSFYSMNQYITTLQTDPVADQYVDIIAVHGYAADGITPGFPDYSSWTNMYNSVRQGTYPKELWMTETELDYSGFASALKVAGAIHGSLRYGNISWWTNWAFEAMQVVKNVPTSSFYTTKNYFKYIRPGAVRVGSSSSHPDILESAFYHPVNKTYTIVLINKGSASVPVQLKGNNIPTEYQAFRTSKFENFVQVDSVKNSIFLLPPSSVTTLYATHNSILTMDAMADQYLDMNAPAQVDTVTGISNGSGSVSGLTLSVKTSNPGLITQLSVSSIDPNGTALVNYTPAASQSGAGQITLTLTDGLGNSREMVYYVIVGPTGINKEVTGRLSIYPNPATSSINVVVPNDSYKKLEIMDISGKMMLQQSITSAEVAIDISNFDKGIYFVRINGSSQILMSKLVKE